MDTSRSRANRRLSRVTPQFVRRLSSWLTLSTALTISVASQEARGDTTYTWNQTAAGTTYLWNASTNWTPNGFPNLPGDIANLNNDIAGNQTVSLNQYITIGTLNIGDATGTSTFTLAGGTGGYLFFDVANDAAAINKTTGGADTISALMQFQDDLQVTNSTGSTLTISGAMRSTTSNISFNGTGTITVTGAIATGGGLTKNGNGTTNLNVASTYAGPTVINGGKLAMGNAASLPVRSAVTVAAGATLDLLNTSLTIGSLSGGGTVNASTASTLRTLTIGRDDTSTTFSGQIIAPATKSNLAITKIGAGTLTLAPTAASDYTGATILNGGTLQLDFTAGSLTSMLGATPVTIGGGNLSVKGRSTGSEIIQTVGALTIGASGGSIVMDANGSTLGTTLTFTGATVSNVAGGSLLINAPANTTVRLGSAMDTATTINGRIVFTDGTIYSWAANTGAASATVGLATYQDAAGGTLAASNSLNTRIQSTNAGEVTTIAAGGSVTNSLRIHAGAAGQSLSLGADTLTLTNGGLLFTGAEDYLITSTTGAIKSGTTSPTDLIIHQYGTGNLTIAAKIIDGAAASTLTKAGTGVLTLTGANTFTGGVFVNGGVLSFSAVAAGAAGGLGNATGPTVVTIRDGATLRYTGSTGTIAATGAGSHTYTLQGGNGTIEVTTSGQTLTLTGAVGGVGGLTKAGAGTLILGGTGGYTGPTYISAGVLQMGPTGGAVNGIGSLSPLIMNGGTLDINGSAASQTLTVGSLSGTSGSILNNASNAKTLSVGGDNTSTTFSGALAVGAGSSGNGLAKIGSGVLTMAGTSAWTGTTSVNGGTLRLGANGALNAGAPMVLGNLASGGTVLFDLNGFNQTVSAITFYGSTSTGSPQANISIGTGTLTMGGNIAYTGTTAQTFQAAYITAAAGGTLSVGGATRTITVNDSAGVAAGDAELTISAPISSVGAFGITKAGLAPLLLTAENTYSGTTTVNAGNLILRGPVASIASSPTIVVGDNSTAGDTFSIGTVSDAWTGVAAGRLHDAAAITIGGGGVFSYAGPASGFTTETVGALTVSFGASTLTLTPGTGSEITLAAASIARTNAGILLVRGDNLGGSGVGSTRLSLATAPAGTSFVGGGGAGGSTNISIVPYLVGDTSSTGAGSSFVTYDTGLGSLRLLTAGEYASAISTAGATDNVSLSGADTVSAAKTINALRVTSGGSAALNAPLTITTGAILFTADGTLSGTGPLAFGSTQAMFTAAANTTPINGTINTTITGSAGILVNTLGNVSNAITLGGNNTFTGGVTVGSGILRLGSAGALNNAAPNTLNMAATNGVLELNGNSVTVNDLDGVAGSIIRNSTSAAGPATLTVVSNNATDFAGSLADGGGAGAVLNFVKQGSATLTISGTSIVASSYTGSTIIQGGALIIGTTPSAALSGTTAVVIEGGPTSILRLSSGDANNDSTDRLNNAATVSLAGGIFDWSHSGTSSVTYSETIGATTLSSGANIITVDKAATSNTATLTLTSLSRALGSGATVELTSQSNTTSVFDLGTSSRSRMVINGTVPLTGGIMPFAVTRGAGAVVGNLNPYEFVKYVSSGTISATALVDADYALNTDPSTWLAAQNVKLTTSTSAVLPASKQINSLNFQTIAATTLTIGAGNTLRIESGGVLASQNNAAVTLTHTITGGTLTAGAGDNAAGELMFHVFNIGSNAVALNVDSVVADNGAGSVTLTKTGSGTLKLGSTGNTYSGGTYINAGVLQVSADGGLGAVPAATTVNSLRLNGGTLQALASFDLDAKRGIGISAAGGTIIVDPTFTVNYGGIIADNSTTGGQGRLTKSGNGTLALSGANTYSGGTTLTLGTLVAGHDQALGTGALTLGGGILQGANGARTLGNNVIISANSTLAGASDLTFNGTLNQTGGDRVLTINNTGVTTFVGAFNLDRGATAGNLTVTAGTGATVNIQNLQDGTGTGAGTLTKTGAGALNISNAFNINGSLVANGGVTTLTASGAIVVGNLQVGRSAAASLIYGAASGSLSVGSGASNSVEIGSPGASQTANATVDFTGLDNFTANVGNFRVGVFVSTSATAATANVKLATNNNITAATAFVVSDNIGASNGLGGPVTLLFGGGTNVLKTPTILIGNAKSAASTQVTIGAGGTLAINNGAGVPTDLSIGIEDFNTGTIMGTTVDFSGGIVTATLDDVILAQRSLGGAGTTTATLTFGTGANAITANTLKIGSINTGTAATGTLNFGGGTFDLTGDAVMAINPGTGTVRGTLNITGGTFTIGGNITKGTGTSTAVVIVDGATATLDMTDGSIAASQLAFRGGNINNLTGGVTLDAISTTTGTGNTGDALILRDVTLNSAVTLTGATGGAIHYEAAGGGAGATINGVLALGSVARTFNIEDSAGSSSELTISGDLTGTNGFTKTGAGALRLSGATAQSFTGAVAVQNGRVILGGGANQRIASTNAVTLGNATASGVLQLGDASGKSDLALDSLSQSGTGAASAVVGGASAISTLTWNVASNTTFNAGFGGAGTNENKLSVIKNGAGNLAVSGLTNIAGDFAVNGGAVTLTSASAVGGALIVNGGSLSGGFGATGTSILVGAGLTLNFTDSAIVTRSLVAGNVINLGAGATIGFEVGEGGADGLLGGGSSTALVLGQIKIDLFSIGNIATGTYNLISAPGGGLTTSNGSTGSYILQNLPLGSFQYSLNATDTVVQLIITETAVSTMYWRGDVNGSWTTNNSGDTNWSTDAAGTLDPGSSPGSSTDVFFSANSAVGPVISTTLDGSFSVKSLTFLSAPSGVTAVNIASGTPATSELTVGSGGINVQDNAGTITISAPLVIGAAQAWTVGGTGASLIFGGNISGNDSIEKLGLGTAILTGTVTSYTGTMTITAGTLQLGNGGTTGTLGAGAAINNNAALVLNYGSGSVTVASAISGTGSLTKTGAGTAVLSGANTYTGKTIVTAGALAINDESRLGNNPAAFVADQLTLNGGTLQTTTNLTIDDPNRGISLGASGGILSADASTTVTISSTLGGVGSLILAGAGTVAFGADQTLSGANNGLTFGATNGSTTLSKLDLTNASATFGGVLRVQTNSATANTITIGSGKTLTTNNNVTIGADLATATTRLNVSGAGSWTVTRNGGVFQVGGGTGATDVSTTTLDMSGLSTFSASLGSAGVFRVGDLNSNSTTTGSTANSTVILAANSTITAGTIAIGDGTAQGGSTQTLRLGSGTNTINAASVNVGGSANGRAGGVLNFNGATGTVSIHALDGTSAAIMNVSNITFSTGANVSSSATFTGHEAYLELSTLTIGRRTANTGGATASMSFGDGTANGYLHATTVVIGEKTSGSTATSNGVSGTLNISGGTNTIGTLSAAINGSASAGAGAVGGTLAISGGTTTIGAMTLGTSTSGTAGSAVTATFNVSGGTVTLNGNLNTSSATSGTVTTNINLTGGSLTVSGNLVRTGGAGTTATNLKISGGVLDMGGGGTPHSIGSAANPVTLTAESGTLSNVSAINGTGGLTKTTTGTLTLAGTNSYTGATDVSQGTVVVSGSLSGSTVSVAGGAELRLSNGTITTPAALSVAGTLSGAGTVAGSSGAIDVATTGTVSPGAGNDSAGVLSAKSLTTSGDLTNKATLRMELLSDSSYDRIATTDSINLASGENTTLTLLISGSYAPVNGTMFFIVTNSSANAATTGLFAGTITQTVANFESLGAVPTITASNGQLFAISYSGDFEAVGGPAFTGGNDIVLMAVPEPNSLAMLAGSLGLALGLQRFRRRGLKA